MKRLASAENINQLKQYRLGHDKYSQVIDKF